VGQPQTFRSPTAVVIWIVWLLFAAGNWIDLSVQGRDHLSVVAAATLLLATGVGYVAAQRPRIIADDAGVTVRNPLRDHRIGWAGVVKVDLVDLLRVHCARRAPAGAAPAGQERTKVISAWAVHYSRRRQLAAEARARRAAQPPGRRSSHGAPDPGASAAQAEAEMIVRMLSERATAAQAQAVWVGGANQTAGAAGETGPAGETMPAGRASPASGTTTVAAAGWTDPLTSTWSGRAIAALVIPALVLTVVCLL
jgi:Bacterial PH domain